ncbi:MAG: hypothetical protein ACK55I_13715, partial [bacterium]
MAEAQQHHDGIGGVECARVGEAAAGIWVDKALGIHRKENRALEAVALGQDAGEHRHRLFGAVFFVACEQDDVLAGARALAGGEFQPTGTGGEGFRGDGREREDEGGQGG